MLISSSKAQSKQTISERDLILANALAYVEAIEEKMAQRELARDEHAQLQTTLWVDQHQSLAAPTAPLPRPSEN